MVDVLAAAKSDARYAAAANAPEEPANAAKAEPSEEPAAEVAAVVEEEPEVVSVFEGVLLAHLPQWYGTYDRNAAVHPNPSFPHLHSTNSHSSGVFVPSLAAESSLCGAR